MFLLSKNGFFDFPEQPQITCGFYSNQIGFIEGLVPN